LGHTQFAHADFLDAARAVAAEHGLAQYWGVTVHFFAPGANRLPAIPVIQHYGDYPPPLRWPSRGCLLFPCMRSSQSSLIQKVLAASTRHTA
jgi:hypothetical protein